nr:hypothetical protein [Tanacetum cinerariifolium]
IFEAHALEAKFHPVAALLGAHVGRQHLQREVHILGHRHRIEQGRTLEKHPDFAPNFLPDIHFRVGIHRPIEGNGAEVRLHQTHDAREQHAFAGTRAAEQQVTLACFEGAGDAFEHRIPIKRFLDVGYFNHYF